jgi:hypothetical protein
MATCSDCLSCQAVNLAIAAAGSGVGRFRSTSASKRISTLRKSPSAFLVHDLRAVRRVREPATKSPWIQTVWRQRIFTRDPFGSRIRLIEAHQHTSVKSVD